MPEHLYLISIGLILGTPLLIFGMKYASAAYQARARIQGDDAYRNIAAKAVTAQSEGAALLSNIQNDLSEIKFRLGTIEKILKAVE